MKTDILLTQVDTYIQNKENQKSRMKMDSGIDLKDFYSEYENDKIAFFIRKLEGEDSVIYKEYVSLINAENGIIFIIKEQIKILERLKQQIKDDKYLEL